MLEGTVVLDRNVNIFTLDSAFVERCIGAFILKSAAIPETSSLQ